jgi:hypothetical protein
MGLKDWFNKGKQGNEESSGDEGGKVVPLRDIEVQVSGFGVGGSVKHNQKSGIEDVTDAVSQLYRKGVEDGRDAGCMAGQVEGFVVGHDRGVETGFDYGVKAGYEYSYQKAIEDILKAASEDEEEE